MKKKHAKKAAASEPAELGLCFLDPAHFPDLVAVRAFFENGSYCMMVAMIEER
jgi:hypothetical protein